MWEIVQNKHTQTSLSSGFSPLQPSERRRIYLPYKIITLVLIRIDQTVVQGSFPARRAQSRALSLGYRAQSPRGHPVSRAVPVLSATAPAVRSTGAAAATAIHTSRARPGDGPRCTAGLLLLPSA